MVETQKNKKNLFHYACQYGNADMINLLGFCAKTIHGNDKFNTDKLLYEKLQSPYTFYYDLLYLMVQLMVIYFQNYF